MSQAPPPPSMNPYPSAGFPQPPKTNGFAVGSLICGIVGCLQITSLAAIILGVLGVKKSKEPGTGGKGMAIAGIVLGILWIVISIGLGIAGYAGYKTVKGYVLEPTQQVGQHFLNSLESGDTATAGNYTTGEFSTDQLSKISSQVKSYGHFKNFSLNQIEAVPSGNRTGFRIGGVANFEGTSKGFHAVVVGNIKDPSSFRIESFTLD